MRGRLVQFQLKYEMCADHVSMFHARVLKLVQMLGSEIHPARVGTIKHAPTLPANVWQMCVKKGATKPRKMLYDKSGLSFHNGNVAVVVDIL